MRIVRPGRISDRLIFLGDSDVAMYLLLGERYLFIGGGLSHLPPIVERQLDEWGVDRSRITGLVILHSHFDHSTAVPYFQRAYPHIRVMASVTAAKTFQNPRAVEAITKYEGLVRQHLGTAPTYRGVDLSFTPPTLARTLQTGDRIDLGDGIEVHVAEVPGHSTCCLAAYVPAIKTLFPSDAAPLPIFRDEEPVVMANDDLPLYIQSLKRMAQWDVEQVAFEHGGVITGEAGRSYLAKALDLSRSLCEEGARRLRNGESAEDLARECVQRIVSKQQFQFIPVPVMERLMRRMFESAARGPC